MYTKTSLLNRNDGSILLKDGPQIEEFVSLDEGGK